MKRTASLGDLDWIQDGDSFYADLPPIPGYSTPDNPAVAVVYHSLVGYWMLNIVIGDGDYVLDEATFGDLPGAYSYTPQQWKDYVESLTPEEIAAMFDEGYPDGAIASRHAKHATRRKASSSDFVWESDNGGAMTEYPYLIPGYPGDLNIYITPMKNAADDTCPWDVTACYYPQTSGYSSSINVDCWSIIAFKPQGGSLENVEQAVENLDPADFSYALDVLGVEPVLDENGGYSID